MKELDFQSLKSVIKENREKRVMLTFHSIGDTDSVSSAFALQKCFKNAAITMPDQITSNSRRILERLGFRQSSITTEFDQNAEMVVLLDVNNFEDCGKFKGALENFKGTVLIIDHHTPNDINRENVLVFNDESYNSAASIVYELLKSMDINVEKNLANLIATGIISDSAELRNAFPTTFIQIGELLEKAEIDYQSMLLEMHHIAKIENREGFIKDLFKAQTMVIGRLLVVYGKSEIHANKLADDGIRIGADVSIFYTTTGSEVSFSARLRPPLDRECKINLGKLMRKLAPIINGQGGGHPCAAGSYGPGSANAQKFMDSFMQEIANHVRNK